MARKGEDKNGKKEENGRGKTGKLKNERGRGRRRSKKKRKGGVRREEVCVQSF